jgi:hypothetical protein
VLQPVIQFGAAIYGKNFTGGALNGSQKPLRVHCFFSPSTVNTFPSRFIRTCGIHRERLLARIRVGKTILEMPEKCKIGP